MGQALQNVGNEAFASRSDEVLKQRKPRLRQLRCYLYRLAPCPFEIQHSVCQYLHFEDITVLSHTIYYTSLPGSDRTQDIREIFPRAGTSTMPVINISKDLGQPSREEFRMYVYHDRSSRERKGTTTQPREGWWVLAVFSFSEH
jgi:hypothetical protein